jgi:hypothetical protein
MMVVLTVLPVVEKEEITVRKGVMMGLFGVSTVRKAIITVIHVMPLMTGVHVTKAFMKKHGTKL